MKKITLIILGVVALTISSYGQCFISGFGSLGQLSKTTGYHTLDNKFNMSKVDLESLFRIKVDLYVYNDGYSPNAYATRGNSYFFDGLVAFGINMLMSRLWSMDKGEYAVAGVLAHEFAHVLQIKKSCSLPTKQKELQADFLAGYYFGKRNYLSYGLKNFATDLYTLGDYNFWHPQHHGTPQERVSAMVAGYQNSYKSVNEAYQAGINYVTGKLSTYDDDDDDEPSITYENCSKCDGTGEIERTKTCIYCSGAGVMVCYTCGGNGGVYSYGYNVYGVYGYWWYVCNSCGGAKVSYCNSCSGTGTTTTTRKCDSCNGTGRKRKY